MANVTNILWQTDGAVITLPSRVHIPDHYLANTNAISDFLSREYGYLHNGFVENYTDVEVLKLWNELEDVTFIEDEDNNLILASDWRGWSAGTSQSEIWNWFNDQYSKGLLGLADGERMLSQKLLTWDDIYNAADGAGCGDSTLVAKDNARNNVRLLAKELGGTDLNADECPEDTVEYICDTLSLGFNDTGDIVYLTLPRWVEKIIQNNQKIAKKPLYISEAADSDNANVCCPVCLASSDYAYDITRGHCWKCGQLLDWSNWDFS